MAGIKETAAALMRKLKRSPAPESPPDSGGLSPGHPAYRRHPEPFSPRFSELREAPENDAADDPAASPQNRPETRDS